jgi:hypothetical protein
MGACSFFPISDNPDWDQNAPRLKQTRGGSNNLPLHSFEQIGRCGHPACDATTDIREIHG